ncbi:MAG: iron ABC transporter permease [SAR92 clade bacterium]|uniref:Iron ABC transporter permease n=1 Tax=SAR92 clade bacterium TaxID=2315479 RepID=A0A520MPG9_9GAMM|nr:MAG: iron ABC transporter permease [SAR92 clade bacterium]
MSAMSSTEQPTGRRWRASLFIVTAVIALPILVIFASLLLPFSTAWQHLFETVLTDYVTNSLILMIGVGFGTLLLGVSAAWLTGMCDFPGRKILSWAFLLPMAMPAYIIAYTYTGILDFSGPIQNSLRGIFDWQYGDYYFPQVRSLSGAICMLSLVLYPYVYMLVRVAFIEQSTAVLEASRNLGKRPWETLFQVAIPMARPAIVAGVSLALMETLADYGTVAYFGVNAFTTGIFRTWYGLGDLTTAAQLCAFLMLFVFALILAERWSRQRLRFHHDSAQKKMARMQLKGWRAILALSIGILIVSLGFIIPAGQLALWAATRIQENLNANFLSLLFNSFALASLASLCCLIIAIFLAYTKRVFNSRIELGAVGVASLGYAVPGTVIAVGVLIPVAWLDNQIDFLSKAWFNYPTGLLLSGTIGILVFAYVIRFLSVALNTVDSGLTAIKPSIDESARSLGATPVRVLSRVHLPILRTSLLTALLLVFVEVLKELPTTLILRPFNFNTLAVRTYELASDERLIDAALPALAIVIIGLLPVLLITKSILNERSTNE